MYALDTLFVASERTPSTSSLSAQSWKPWGHSESLTGQCPLSAPCKTGVERSSAGVDFSKAHLHFPPTARMVGPQAPGMDPLAPHQKEVLFEAVLEMMS